MDSFTAQQQLATSARAHAAATEQGGRRCVLFGYLESAAWLVSDPQGAELAAYEIDLDVVLNDVSAGCRWTARCGWRSGGRGGRRRFATIPTRRAPDVDLGRVAVTADPDHCP